MSKKLNKIEQKKKKKKKKKKKTPKKTLIKKQKKRTWRQEMSKKYTFASLVNCSNRFFGTNDKSVYFPVETRFPAVKNAKNGAKWGKMRRKMHFFVKKHAKMGRK
jgi:uncharacterized protein YjaZ